MALLLPLMFGNGRSTTTERARTIDGASCEPSGPRSQWMSRIVQIRPNDGGSRTGTLNGSATWQLCWL